jgi:carboxyl-terminal processing protease
MPHADPPSSRPRRAALRRGALVTLCAGGALVGTAAARHDGSGQLLAQVMGLVSGRFVDASTDAALYEKAARGLVGELGDPYSELLSPGELAAFERSTMGRYAGVGMEVVPVGDSVYVGNVYDGPIGRAGARRGDRLLRVDEMRVDGQPLDTVVGRLRGVPDSPVAVVVERTGQPLSLNVRRGVVHVPAVPYVVVERGVAYVPITGFPETAAQDVAGALATAARQGARGVVLDLRGNPGGSVDQAVRIAGTVLPRNSSALTIRERDGAVTLRTPEAPVAPDVPLVVLQDDRSASAAEIVTGALQDHDRALLVGERSYGKGVAQSLYTLRGGWALKLTTARWYTPSGRSIHRDRTAGDSVRRANDVAYEASLPKHYRSDAGRALAGGGGIAPDVLEQPDTLVGGERQLALALAQAGPRVAPALARATARLARGVDSTFRVTPAWRDTLRAELARGGVRIAPAVWDGGAPFVDRLLEQRVADFAFGPALAGRRALAYDRSFQLADSLLRTARSGRDLVLRGTPPHAPG